jgi:hypothetical protein
VALVRLDGGMVAGLLGLGERPRVEARLPALESMFLSLKRADVRRDPSVVGIWHHAPHAEAGQPNARITAVLGSDGSAELRGPEGGKVGTWTSGDGVLFLQWIDGSSAGAQYQVEGRPGGRRLTLLFIGERSPMEWSE